MIDAASARRFPARDLTVPDPLSAYLSRMSRVALLTHREEVELGRRVRAGDRIARRTLIEWTCGSLSPWPSGTAAPGCRWKT